MPAEELIEALTAFEEYSPGALQNFGCTSDRLNETPPALATMIEGWSDTIKAAMAVLKAHKGVMVYPQEQKDVIKHCRKVVNWPHGRYA